MERQKTAALRKNPLKHQNPKILHSCDRNPQESDWRSDVKSTNYLRSAANNLCLCPCSEHALSQDHWNKPLGLEICIKKKK